MTNELNEIDRHYRTASNEVFRLCLKLEVSPGEITLGDRHVVLLLGETSAGKSSLVNHVFGCEIKRTSAMAEDDHFTFVEAVPADEFRNLGGFETSKSIVLSKKDLQTPQPLVGAAKWEKQRLGNLFVKLSPKQCVERYCRVLSALPESLRRNFTAIIVNGDYVKDKRLHRLVLIDSEGLSFGSLTMMKKFRSSLSLLDIFFRISDRVLFLVRAGAMDATEQALQCLQMLLFYHVARPELKQDLIADMDEWAATRTDGLIASASGFVGKVADVAKHDRNMWIRALATITSTAMKSRSENNIHTSSRRGRTDAVGSKESWAAAMDKLLFAITQMDTCVELLDESGTLIQFGLLFGRTMHPDAVTLFKPRCVLPFTLPAFQQKSLNDGGRECVFNFLSHLQLTTLEPSGSLAMKRLERERELRRRLLRVEATLLGFRDDFDFEKTQKFQSTVAKAIEAASREVGDGDDKYSRSNDSWSSWIRRSWYSSTITRLEELAKESVQREIVANTMPASKYNFSRL